MMLLIALIVLVTAAVIAGDCPNACECVRVPRDLNNPSTALFYTSVQCNADIISSSDNAISSSVLLLLPDTINSLTFDNVSTFSVENLFDKLIIIQKLPYFSQLTLRHIALPNLKNVSVSGLDRLRKLEITQCHMKYMPHLNLTSLQILELPHNALRAIVNEQFRTLPQLEVLNLSANALETIEPNGFVGLKNLKHLDLSSNNLALLENNVLVPLTTLQHLNLSNNKLEVLNEASFGSLFYLQQLDVSWNRLARVAPGSLELPSLARLLLAGNPQLGEPALFVGTGRRLQTVDASRTGLKQVPAALTHSIRTLHLAGNSIPSVNCGDLDSYPLLQLLDFTSNALAEIEEDALGRLDSLTILYLTDNKLRSIPHSLPEKLRVLHLEHNQIENVQSGDLQGLTQLEVLLLNSNKIHVIKDAPFSQLTSLATLDLSHNPINELPSGSLAGPVQLQILKLAGLAAVISSAKEMEFPLPAPEHLIALDLSSSPSLARQMLADTACLAAARELQELNLASAGLNYIRSDLLHFLPQLRTMHLRDNPLNCSGMQWLAEWLRRQDNSEDREVICAMPADLWGTLLVDLQSIETTTINHKANESFTTISPLKTTTTTTTTTSGGMIEHAKNTTPTVAAAAAAAATTLITSTAIETSTHHPHQTTVHDNVKHDKYILGYPHASMKPPMNILPSWKSSLQKVNSVLKELDAPGNLFMKKSVKNDNGNDAAPAAAAAAATQVGVISGTSPELKENVTGSGSSSSSTGGGEVMSMYSSSGVTGDVTLHGGATKTRLAHPGMIVLAVGVLATAAVLITLTTRIKSRRNNHHYNHHHHHHHHQHHNHQQQHVAVEDIEVSSLPSVTELW